NQWELTRQCVNSLLLSRNITVMPMLVDNGSESETPDWVEKVPGMRFLRSGENLGFGGGNNKAFSLFDDNEAPWTLVLNNDTTVTPDTLRILVELLRERPSAGIATPAIFYADRPDMVWSAGGNLSKLRMIFHQSMYPTRKSLPDQPKETGFASGCAIMMRTSLYRELCGFREDFFLYHEDSHLCLRCLRMGKSILLQPRGEVFHHVSAAAGGSMSPISIYFTHRNRYLLAREELSPLELAVFTFYYLAVSCVKTFIYPVRKTGRSVPYLWKAVLDGLKGQTGNTLKETD
ncbi:MAG: glycosyltransferase family 2 protein, partial [Candidatus Fermentibacteria bacterium]